MARTVASLAVEVLARTEKLEKGVNQITKRIDSIADTAVNASKRIGEVISAPFVAGAKGVAVFAHETANTVEGLNRLAETAENTGKKIATLVGKSAEFALRLPVGNAITSALYGVATAMQVVIRVGVGIAAVTTAFVLFQNRALLMSIRSIGSLINALKILGPAWLQAFASQSVQRILPFLGLLIGKLMIVSGIAGAAMFLGMAASVESANRKFAEMLGRTTPLQQAMEKLGDAWFLWADFVVGDFTNNVGKVLHTIASILIEIVKVIRFVNDVSGGWVKTLITLLGYMFSLYAAMKMIAWITVPIRAAWAFIGSSAVFKPVIAAWTLMRTQLDAMLARQLGLNAATAFYVSLTIVGLALVAVAFAAQAAYAASVTSEYDNCTVAAGELAEANGRVSDTFEKIAEKATKAVGQIKNLVDYRNQIKVDALTVDEKDAAARQKIQDATNPVAAKNRAMESLWKEMDWLESSLEATEKQIENLRVLARGDDGKKAELERKVAELNALNRRIEENRKSQADVHAAKITPFSDAERAFANRARIESNLKDLGIETIQTAEEVYTEKLRNINKALEKKWVNLEQYNRQVEAAAKHFQETDPVTKARIEAEKKLADSLKQSAKTIYDSLKDPWAKYADQSKLINDAFNAKKLDPFAAGDADTKNRADLRSALGFADIRTPSEQLAKQLGDLVRYTKEFGTSEINVQQQLDKFAGDLASAAGIGDLFDDLHENRVAGLAKAFEGIEGLAKIGKITETVAAELQEKAARKFLKENEGPQKGPSIVQRGTTEAYQRDQEIKREAVHAQKQLEELKKLQEEAAKMRREQEETRQTSKRIEENTAVLKQFASAGL